MRHVTLMAFLGWLGLLAGCATPPSPAVSTPAVETGTAHRLKEDPRVGVYTSRPWGFSTHSYWIEGPEGLIVIDTQFLPSAARELIEMAERETGKKVVLAVVLHPNPDKFNGTRVFQERGIRVVTSQQVGERIPSVFALRTRWFKDRYAPDWPEQEPRPDVFGAETTELRAAGLTLKAHVMGPGCSAAQVVVEWEGHLFVGDLVGNGTHAWLELGLQYEWLERLDELMRLKPRQVHPGRGASGGPELLTAERKYLEMVIVLVRGEDPTLPVKDEAVDKAVARVKAAFPDLRFEVFLEVGMPAVYRREAELRASPPRLEGVHRSRAWPMAWPSGSLLPAGHEDAHRRQLRLIHLQPVSALRAGGGGPSHRGAQRHRVGGTEGARLRQCRALSRARAARA